MLKVTRMIVSAACVCLVLCVLAGCGGGGGSPNATVARVGAYAITRGMLNQWMTEQIGETFVEMASHQVPAGLVSEPANYPGCVSTLRSIEPIPGKGPRQPIPSTAQLMSKCKELYAVVKAQALAFLVSGYWVISFDASHGITANNKEVEQSFRQGAYPKGVELQQLLKTRRRTLAQELFMAKLDLLSEKVKNEMRKGGTQLTTKLFGEAQSANATASCLPGYVVEHCKGYKGPQSSGIANLTAPAILLQEIARWRPETSHGFTGQPVR